MTNAQSKITADHSLDPVYMMKEFLKKYPRTAQYAAKISHAWEKMPKELLIFVILQTSLVLSGFKSGNYEKYITIENDEQLDMFSYLYLKNATDNISKLLSMGVETEKAVQLILEDKVLTGDAFVKRLIRQQFGKSGL